MLVDASIGAVLFFVLVAPSLFAWWRWRRLAPRAGSIFDHARTLARHRLVAVLAAQLVLLLVEAARPDLETALPDHHYGPRTEAWLSTAIVTAALAALVSLGATLCMVVVIARELSVVRRAWSALRAVANSKRVASANGSEAAAPRPIADELGLPSPTIRPALLGPFLSTFTTLLSAVLFFLDVMLTLGD